jgi:hypothetical protein
VEPEQGPVWNYCAHAFWLFVLIVGLSFSRSMDAVTCLLEKSL